MPARRKTSTGSLDVGTTAPRTCSSGLELTFVGRDELNQFLRELFTALPDVEFATEAIHDVDERTAVGQWRLSGTFCGGPFLGTESTGDCIAWRGGRHAVR